MRDALLGAFVGAVLGALASSWFQHRQWLRDVRRQAYGRTLVAYDDLTRATNSYVAVLEIAMAAHGPDGPDMWSETEGEKAYATYREASDQFHQTLAELQLVASKVAVVGVILLALRFQTIRRAHSPIDDPAALLEKWHDEENRRTEDRVQFLKMAKYEIGIDVTLMDRLRAVRRRFKGRWMRMKRRRTQRESGSGG